MKQATRQHMTLDVSDTAKACLAERGFDIRYGARPLKRALAKEILNPLSKLVLEGSVAESDTVRGRTRGEAMKLQKVGEAEFGWTTGSHSLSENKNDVVLLKNRDAPSNHHELVAVESSSPSDVDDWEDLDEDFLHA